MRRLFHLRTLPERGAGAAAAASAVRERFGNGFLVESFPDEPFCYFICSSLEVLNQTDAPLVAMRGVGGSACRG